MIVLLSGDLYDQLLPARVTLAYLAPRQAEADKRHAASETCDDLGGVGVKNERRNEQSRPQGDQQKPQGPR